MSETNSLWMQLAVRLKRMVEVGTGEAIKTVRTSVPGYVLEFEPDRQYATLQVGIQRLDIAGRTYTPPPIVNCPVCIYGSAGGAIETKIEKGDEVLILFSMRCIEGWRNQGGVAPLTSIELFRESDAFAVLAPRSSKNVITGYSNDGIRVRSLDGTRYVWLKDDGTIEMKNENGSFSMAPGGDIDANGATIDTSGNVITADDADLNAIRDKLNELIGRFNDHTHTGNQGSPTPLIGDPVETV